MPAEEHLIRRLLNDTPHGKSARLAQSGNSKVYLYFYTHVPPIPNSEYFGAFHAAEIAFAFNNLVDNDQTTWQRPDPGPEPEDPRPEDPEPEDPEPEDPEPEDGED